MDERFSRVTPIQSLHNSSLGPNSSPTDVPPSIIQGSLLLKLSKPTKIKDISQLRFYGKYKTDLMNANTDPSLLIQCYPLDRSFRTSWLSVHTRGSFSQPPAPVNKQKLHRYRWLFVCSVVWSLWCRRGLIYSHIRPRNSFPTLQRLLGM